MKEIGHKDLRRGLLLRILEICYKKKTKTCRNFKISAMFDKKNIFSTDNQKRPSCTIHTISFMYRVSLQDVDDHGSPRKAVIDPFLSLPLHVVLSI